MISILPTAFPFTCPPSLLAISGLYLQPRGIDKARVRYVQGLSLAPEMLAVSDSLEELKLKEPGFSGQNQSGGRGVVKGRGRRNR